MSSFLVGWGYGDTLLNPQTLSTPVAVQSRGGSVHYSRSCKVNATMLTAKIVLLLVSALETSEPVANAAECEGLKLSISNILAAALLAGASNTLPTDVPNVPAVTTSDSVQTVPPLAPTAPSAESAPEPVATDLQNVVADAGSAPEVTKDTIIVTAKSGPPPGDPAEAVNEVSFIAVTAVDKAIIAPVAHGYKKGIPLPIQQGVHNVLNNLDEPIVFVNFVLQLKIGKAFETVGRFAINSTIGLAGLIDVARKKPFNLPRRSNGLADTLGFYGVGPGPYLFLPLIGSTSVRDLLGRVADLSLLPTAVGKPFTQPLVSLTKGTLSSLDDRVENDEILTRVQQSDNPYGAMREYYLTKRQAEIDVLKGKRANADIDLDELQLLKLADEPKPATVIAPAAPEAATVTPDAPLTASESTSLQTP